MNAPLAEWPKSRCPSCFALLNISTVAFRCAGSCQEIDDPQLSAALGAPTKARPVLLVHPTTEIPWDRAVCGSCSTPTQDEVCPGCHHALPPGWRFTTTTCIALAGARDSGKSIYIGVLVKQLERWCEQFDQVFQMVGETAANYRRLYEEPLFHQRGLLKSTTAKRPGAQSETEPLILQVGTFSGVPHMLVLRDVAGEDLENPSVDPSGFPFFNNADLVVFLFDPMAVKEIKDQLLGALHQARMDATDPAAVLNNLVRIMRGGAVGVTTQKSSTPFALVVSKFDILAELTTIEGSPLEDVMNNRGAAFNRDASLSRDYDPVDAALLAAEVESLLSELNARALLTLVRNYFAVQQTFAVSALGNLPPTDSTVSGRGIAPQRVLDPIKWAMLSLRYSTLTP